MRQFGLDYSQSKQGIYRFLSRFQQQLLLAKDYMNIMRAPSYAEHLNLSLKRHKEEVVQFIRRKAIWILFEHHCLHGNTENAQ